MNSRSGRALALARQAAIPAVAGAALPLGFAPFGWWPVAIASPALLFAAIAKDRGRSAFWRAFCYGVGAFGVGVSWISESFQFNNVHGPIVWLLTVGFVLFLALFPALAALLATVANRFGPVWRAGVALPAAWLVLEWIRGWLLTGFTWLQLGYSQVDSPAAVLAPIAGSYACGLLAAASAGALASLWVSRSRGPIIAATALGLVWVGLTLVGSINFTRAAGPPMQVALIQGNYAQDVKWRPQNLAPTLERYRVLTSQALDAGARLVIWPETAIPSLASRVANYLDAVRTRARAQNATVLLGVPTRVERGFHNSVLALGATEGAYHKRHLVPFGEYVPFAALLLPVMQGLGVPIPRFIPATGKSAVLALDAVRLGVSICYEAAFGHEIRQTLSHANLLVNVSNDAWFGDTLAPHQHLQIVRMRALESGRPIARATNTGLTAAIGPDGRVLRSIEPFEVGVLHATLQPTAGLTPYARVGDAPVALLAFSMWLLPVVVGVRRTGAD
ncbi:MAG: apolipoprotein N-acyltransferase [Pseudomonadota bacterium]